MQLVVGPDGLARAIYGEDIDLSALGRPTIARASRVEPDAEGLWRADLSPVGGPVLGPFALRSAALAAEHAWLERNWLEPPDSAPEPRPRRPLMPARCFSHSGLSASPDAPHRPDRRASRARRAPMPGGGSRCPALTERMTP